MALEAYLDSNGQFALPLVASSRGTGVLLESLGSSILLQSDGLSDVAAASRLDMSSGNLSDSIASMARLSGNLVSGTRYSGVLNSGTNSGRSVGASSLVTDANSPLAGGARLQSSGTGNMDPYHNLPSSPLSFSSNALSTSVLDASSIVQLKPSYREEQNCQLGQKRLLPQYRVGATGTPHTTSQTHQVSLPMGKNQEPAITQIYKKQRPDMNPENIQHQEIVQQLLQKQDSVQLQDHSQQLLALMQQHKLRNQQQQQILQSIPQLLGVPAQAQQQQQQQQQRQMRQHLQQQANHHVPALHLDDGGALHLDDGGICSRRLMQYIYHLRHRPPDNSIAYWKKFVAEYFAPGAKKRWCLSLYDSIGEHALGVFSQAAMEAWHCDICGSKSGKGFEAIFEILPRLSKIKFESGVIDELLFLDFPHECRFPSGLMMLSYGKAVEESVYEQFRVVREGQLRIIFTRDLKILSWEFCARHHEELVPRRLVAPQVNQLVLAAKKYLSTAKDGGFDGVSPQDLQLNCNTFLTAGRQLTRNLDLLLVNDLGFSKRYVRCLQIAEVVNSMKDLMTFSHDNNIGPMESLRKYGRKETKTNKQMKQMLGMEWLANAKIIPTDANKGVAVFPEPPSPSSNMNESSSMTKGGIMCSSEEVALAGMNEYHKLLRKNATSRAVKQEPSCSINCCSQIAIPIPVVGCPQSSSSGLIQSSSISESSTSHPSQGSDSQQHLINKLLQEMVANSSRAKGGLIANGKAKEEALLEQDNKSAVGEFSAKAMGKGTFVRSALDSKLGRRDCFQAAASNSNSSAIYGNNLSVKTEPDFLEMLHLHEAVQNIDHGFFKDGALDDDWKEKGWKT